MHGTNAQHECTARCKSLIVSRFSGVLAASRVQLVEIRYFRVATEATGYNLTGAVFNLGQRAHFGRQRKCMQSCDNDCPHF